MNKTIVALATALVVASGFIGHFIDQSTRSHPRLHAALYRIENEGTKILRSGFQCGTQRWSVKTLSDVNASKVNMTPKITNIPTLRSIPAPDPLPSARLAPVETQLWKLGATRVVAFKEELDSDIHLKLQSTIDQSNMIVEIPNPNCVNDPAARLKIATARANFISEVGQPTGYYQPTNRRATIEGVGFFDFVHGQNGVAPNGIELHPVVFFHAWGK